MAAQQVTLSTERLDIGPWTAEDASAALTIFGTEEVTRWLTPAMEPVHDEAEHAGRLGTVGQGGRRG